MTNTDPKHEDGDDPRHSDVDEPEIDPEATAVLTDEPRREDSAGLQQRLSQAEVKAQENWDSYLRAVADLENLRKRAQRDVENAHRYGLEKFALELLDVKDTLETGVEMSREAGGKTDVRTLVAGKEATLKLLKSAFEKFNLQEINPVGQPFDPQQHEAVMAQESATAEPNSVLQVLQKGYQLGGRLLRPARVIVARSPEAKK